MGKRSAVVELFLGDMGSIQRKIRPSMQREDQLTMETKLEQIAAKAGVSQIFALPRWPSRHARTGAEESVTGTARTRRQRQRPSRVRARTRDRRGSEPRRRILARRRRGSRSLPAAHNRNRLNLPVRVDERVRVVDEGAFRPSGKNAAVRIVEGLAA